MIILILVAVYVIHVHVTLYCIAGNHKPHFLIGILRNLLVV